MKLLTNSRAKTAHECLRKEHIKYVLGYRTVATDAALFFGTLFHVGLEAWWKAPNNRLDAAIAALRSVDKVDPFDLERAQVLMAGYDARWLADMEFYEVLGVELEFRAPLKNPETGRASQTWLLAGKIDVVIRDRRDGLVYIVEHKTSGEDIQPGSVYIQRLRLDSQLSTYFVGAAALGYDVAGFIYDIIGKPKIKPLEANTMRNAPETPEAFRARLVKAVQSEPDRYFQRPSVVRLEEDINEFMFDQWQLSSQLHAAHKLKMAPKNTGACFSFKKPCPYWDVCSKVASLTDTSRFVQNDNVHQELSEEAAKEEAK